MPTRFGTGRAITVFVGVFTNCVANPAKALAPTVHTFDVAVCAFARALRKIVFAIQLANIASGLVIPKIVRTIRLAKRAIPLFPSVLAYRLFGFCALGAVAGRSARRFARNFARFRFSVRGATVLNAFALRTVRTAIPVSA